MFVCEGAVSKLTEYRRTEFFNKYVSTLVLEAKRLKISPKDIIIMIERGFEDEH